MRIADVVLGAVVGLGTVAAARQGLEQRAIRRGTRAPAHATTHALPAATGTFERLATWTPPPPRTRLGRAASAAWAAPLTVLGATLVAAGRARAVWDPALGAYVARGVGGPSGRLLRMAGVHANALGHMVVCSIHDPSRALLEHEATHVRQAERLGPAIVPLYLWLGARYGYRDNPLERAARRRASHVTSVRTVRS
jgi:hypothetical protein